jgi:hypothetical protein
MRVGIPRTAVLLIGIVAIGVVPASAQTTPKPAPAFMKLFAPPTPAESIEAPMSAKLADKLAQVWFETADPGCRASKSLDQAAYQKLARTMIVAAGDHMRQLAATAQDGPRAEAQFAAQAGRGATDEMRRLSGDAVVKQFLILNRNSRAVEQTQTFLENIERALLLSRVQTRARASPLATGDSVILEEIEKVSEAPLNYADAHNTKAMKRFLDLMIIAQRSVDDTSNRDSLLTWGPGKLMVILEAPLREHCIMKSMPGEGKK